MVSNISLTGSNDNAGSSVVMGEECGAAFGGLMHSDGGEADTGSIEGGGADHLDEVLGEVLGGGVERDADHMVIDVAHGGQDWVLGPEQQAVIPGGLQPVAQAGLDHREVDHPADVIEGR